MMRSNVLFPAPFAPRTPIFAPGRNASQMSSSTFLSGGWTFEQAFHREDVLVGRHTAPS